MGFSELPGISLEEGELPRQVQNPKSPSQASPAALLHEHRTRLMPVCFQPARTVGRQLGITRTGAFWVAATHPLRVLCRCVDRFQLTFYHQLSQTLQSKHCMLISLIVFRGRAVAPGTSNSSFASREQEEQTDPASTQPPTRPPKSQTFPFSTSLRAAWDPLRGP